jgi:hypothetical protein
MHNAVWIQRDSILILYLQYITVVLFLILQVPQENMVYFVAYLIMYVQKKSLTLLTKKIYT